MTFFYGFLECANRRKSWQLLCDFHTVSDVPWVVIGDFNDLMSQREKKGGQTHPRWLCTGFTKTIEDCGLVEVGFTGYPYTWKKSYENQDSVEEKLDRALASMSWCECFPDAIEENLVASGSDHSLIFLKIIKMAYRVIGKQFRFENSWLRETECRSVVEAAWSSSVEVDVQSKIEFCGKKLSDWGDNLNKSFKSRLKLCRDELYRLRQSRQPGDRQRLLVVEKEYEKVLL